MEKKDEATWAPDINLAIQVAIIAIDVIAFFSIAIRSRASANPKPKNIETSLKLVNFNSLKVHNESLLSFLRYLEN